MTTKYLPGGITVTIGKSQTVSIPPRTFRGHASCMHFDTDKSFLLPASITGVRNIKTFYDAHPGLTMLVNGHTDLIGDAQYNLQLSVERAKSIAAYLKNQVDDWMPWYQSGIASKRWSYGEDQHMLATLTDTADAPYYAGAITNQNDAATQDAARRFQIDNGLLADGQLGPDTRHALVTKYMELEGTSLDPSTPMVIHGCGKFHPIDATTAADEGNRRVEIFLFDGPIDPAPQDPCPAPGCSQYALWVGSAIETLDLCKPQLYELIVEWNAVVANAQPQDLHIRILDGDDEHQSLPMSAATRDGDVARLTFTNLDQSKPYSLHAESSAATLPLFDNQMPALVSRAIKWTRYIEDLLASTTAAPATDTDSGHLPDDVKADEPDDDEDA